MLQVEAGEVCFVIFPVSFSLHPLGNASKTACSSFNLGNLFESSATQYVLTKHCVSACVWQA